jgi:parallel beta-helix repeat protein
VTPGSDDNEFVELNVHHNGTNEYTHGLYITSSRNLVENSTVQENAGAGVHLFSSNTLTVNDNVVRGNWIVSNARAGSWGQGIVVSRGARNRAYNNVVVGNVLGIHVDYSAADTDVYNNTVYANAREGLLIGTGSTGADVRNNIVYANTGGNYYNRGAGTTQSHNLSGVDPRFANPAAGDYRLRADSPAVDAGMILTVVSDDFDGTPRPQHGAFDIGAFELR